MKSSIEHKLNELPYFHQLTYIYFLAKRMYPNYELFAKTENWGKPKMLVKAMKLLKILILEKRKLTEEEQVTVGNLEAVTPDMEDFGSLLSTAAQDTCVLLLEFFNAIINDEKEHISTLVSLPFNAIQMYVEELNDLDYNKKNYDSFVENHPLMEKEQEFQNELYELISNLKEINKAFFDYCDNVETSELGINLAATVRQPVYQ